MFKLANLVLYAKGWYLNTEDIWKDLSSILELDGLTTFNKDDVYSVVASAVQSSDIYRWTELTEVLNGIHPKNCWKYGYQFTEYDMRLAFIYYTLSNLRFLDNKQWEVKTPQITKYPRGKNITTKKLIEVFGNLNK